MKKPRRGFLHLLYLLYLAPHPAAWATVMPSPSPSPSAGLDVARESKDRFRGGTIYEIGSDRHHILFSLRADLQAPAPSRRVFTSSYFDDHGHMALRETATFENLQLQDYEIQQFQLGEIYRLSARRGKLRYTTIGKEGTQMREEDLPTNLVIGPSFVPFIQAHWAELKAGKSVDARLAVPERRETVGFTFQFDRDRTVEKDELLGKGHPDIAVIRMKPSSLFIAAVVKPVYFVFLDDGSRLLELTGRMLPKLRSGNGWKDFDAEAVFTY